MNKVTWITANHYLDTDMQIINYCAKKIEIDWIVVNFNNISCSYNMNEVVEFANENSINIKVFEVKERFRSFKTLLCYTKLMFLVRKINNSVVYFNLNGIPYFYFLWYIFPKKYKSIYAAHDIVEHKKMKYSIIGKLYKKFILTKFKNVHIYSESQLKIFDSRFKNKYSFYIPQNLKNFGIPTEKIDNSKINLLFFGIIRANKGLDFLINGLELLENETKEKIRLTIAGSCDNWSYYQSLIKTDKLYNLNIRFIDNNEIPNFFSKSHFLILPYLDVTQSGPLLISYNYNLPVIANKIEGFNEYIIDKYNGYFFEDLTPVSIKRTIEYIVHNHDNYLVTKNNLNQFIALKFSKETIANNYITMFNNLK